MWVSQTFLFQGRLMLCTGKDELVTHAEKSAEPVAARLASDERRACHTAPLCPINVPILCQLSLISSTDLVD